MSELAWTVCGLAALPLALALWNLRLLRPPRRATADAGVLVSILIPARNEAPNIERAARAALASRDVPIEVLVLDDASTDDTAARVAAIAGDDPRLRLCHGPPLPPGWAGKAHACQRLSEQARGSHLLFVDADVALAPDAAARLAAHARERGAALVSAVPRQRTASLGELLTVPMINFLIYGYLPVAGLRWTRLPGFGAACGQLLFVDAAAYRCSGGHAAHPATRHDGLKLARQMRRSGFRTDLVGGADLATARMYRSFAESWDGFSKNAREGMATPRALPVWTVLLVGGHLLPWLLLPAALLGAAPAAPLLGAFGCSLAVRAIVTLAGRESWWTIPLHPATVAVSLAIQWSALLRRGPGRQLAWKGRLYEAG